MHNTYTRRERERDLKIVFFDISPNLLEGLGASDLGDAAEERLHFRGHPPGLHDPLRLSLPGGLRRRLRRGGRCYGARSAQVEAYRNSE